MSTIASQFIIDDLNELLNEKSSWTFNLESNKSFDEYLKYNECKTVDEVKAINPDYIEDIEDGAWNYRLDALEDGRYMFDSCWGLEEFNVGLPSLINGEGMFGAFGGGEVELNADSFIRIIDSLLYESTVEPPTTMIHLDILGLYRSDDRQKVLDKYGWHS